MAKLYKLTDGTDIFETREMTDEELQEARRTADDTTDGNVTWDLVVDD